MLLTAEKKMNLFNSPLQSFSLPATYTTTVTQRDGRINMGLCWLVIPCVTLTEHF